MPNTKRFICAAIFLACGTPALAENRQPVDLPAGGLGPAVIALGRQAGVSVGISDPELSALQVKRVRGNFGVKEALDRLLKGTGAAYMNVGGNGWRIIRRTSEARTARDHSRKGIALAAIEEVQPEIIVTASKKDTPLSKYPGSATMLSMAEMPIGSIGGSTATLTSRVAGMTSTHLGSGRNRLFIRGIADSSFNGPTQAVVGQYLGETRLNYNAPDPDLRLYDISSIEVLEGPQGTLYGAGSLGGILRLRPAEPQLDALQATASMSVALTAHGDPSADISATLNLPLIEGSLAVRAVGYGIRDGGYIDDTLRNRSDVNRTEIAGGRIAVRAEPGDGWTIDLGGTFQSIVSRDSQYADRNAPRLTRSSAIAEGSSNEYVLGQFIARKEWDSLVFTSATGIVGQDISETYDATPPTGFPTVFRQRSRISLISSENRLTQTLVDGSSWIVGTSLVRNRYRLNRRFGAASFAPTIAGVANGVDEATLFGEFTKAVTPRINVTAGGRLTYVRLSGAALDAPAAIIASVALLQGRRKEAEFLPSFSVTYVPDDSLTFFGKYQESFRPGGIVVRNDLIQRYQNDQVSSFELGLRFGGRHKTGMDGSLSMSRTRWRNIQADLIDATGLPATSNIGTGRIWSIDAVLGWRPIQGLRIEASGVFSDSRLTNPAPTLLLLRNGSSITPKPGVTVIDSNDLPNVARFNGRLSADYFASLPGGFELSLSSWVRYVGRSRLGIGPVLGVPQGNYLDTSLGLRLSRERYGFFLNATNLLDTIGNRFALGSPFTLPYIGQITPQRPRTIRVGMDARF
ncbi:TonB-dependent receptor domain-containing protein [Aquisediminimonas profunda]|uniref:TonB-dependent receptor domain-containing protein n=1 Tax=Aquisediminimonas profunda TaxID=1550733 RepID=UPI001C62509A|nr:TonB-dependent receptor [Aquisediminimonas profunda]